MNNITYLDWDSNFFGYKIGEISYLSENVLDNAKDQNYLLLYLKLTSNNDNYNYVNVLKNGILVDEKVTYLKNLEKLSTEDNFDVEIYSDNFVSKELYDLALQSGTYSRYKVDENFKNNEFERLYKVWIENSVNKLIAKKIIIQKLNNKPIGLLTLGIKNERADIGILAVDESIRGKGVGKNLIEQSFFESKIMNLNNIQVVTQKANKNACSFYEKMGFCAEKTENIYHFWI